MRKGGSQSGFALALLLWMIAGMSLTVAAVIHFARTDTSLAELRIDEAKVRALSAGVTLMLMRDNAMGGLGEMRAGQEDANESDDDEGRNLLRKFLRFDNGIEANAVMHPSNGFVSLNNANQSELQMLLTEMAKLNETMAQDVIDGIFEYRTDYPGFRFVEELLAVEGSTRVVYDRVKGYVHPYRTGALSAENAVGDLKSLGESQQGEASGGANKPGEPARSAVQGRLTFDLIAEQIRNPTGVADSVRAVDVTISLADGAKVYRNRIWVNQTGRGALIRKGPVERLSGREKAQ